MIAADFLQLRATIGTELLVLAHHAREGGGGASEIETLDMLCASLREPLKVAVLGPSGAGKSALINALAGADLCCADKSLVDHFAFGPHKLDESSGAGITRHQRPLALLRDFQFVDTTGCGHLSEQMEMLAARFLRPADVVLFVLPADAAFDAVAWTFAARLVRLRLPGVIFVLNKCDTMSTAELLALVSRAEGKAASLFGGKAFVVAVSARDARSEDADLRTKSGLAALEKVIASKFIESGARRLKLRSICETARGMARDFIARTQAAGITLRAGSGRLSALDSRVNEGTTEMIHQAGAMVWGVSQFYDRALKRVENWLIDKLTLPGALMLTMRRPEFDVADEINVNLRVSIERHVKSSVDVLEADLKTAWVRLHDALSRELGGEGELPAGEPPAINEQNALLQRLDRALESAVRSEDVGRAMLDPLVVLGRWLRAPVVAGLIGLFLALLGVLPGRLAGLHGWRILAATGLAVFVAGLTAAWMLTVSQGSKLSIELRTRMDEQRERVLRTVEEHLRASIHQFHRRLRDSLDAVLGFKTAQEMLMIEPVELQLSRAEAALVECEARIGGAAA
jgi:hypothetical protein